MMMKKSNTQMTILIDFESMEPSGLISVPTDHTFRTIPEAIRKPPTETAIHLYPALIRISHRLPT